MALKGRYIDRAPVSNSSAFTSVGYHPDTQTLALEFKSGGVHHYTGVTQDEADALLGAESIGKHFHAHIKPHYAGEKVDAPAMGTCPACGAKGLTGFLCQDCGVYDYA